MASYGEPYKYSVGSEYKFKKNHYKNNFEEPIFSFVPSIGISQLIHIPDNFSNGSSYNLPLNELKEVIDYAITNGYTAVWDCDVSEKAFSGVKGIAIVPEKEWKNKATTWGFGLGSLGLLLFLL